MPFNVSATLSAIINGKEYKQTSNLTSDNQGIANPSVPAAKTGALTTRTNNTDGTLTMDAGHGFATSDVISLFWAGGSRRNVAVGTVSVNSVPISGGSGDNLPTAATAITAMKATSVPFAVTGDSLESLAVSLDTLTAQGWVVFKAGGGSVLASYQIRTGERDKVWVSGVGITNPLAGVTAATVEFSHDQATAALAPFAACTF